MVLGGVAHGVGTVNGYVKGIVGVGQEVGEGDLSRVGVDGLSIFNFHACG